MVLPYIYLKDLQFCLAILINVLNILVITLDCNIHVNEFIISSLFLIINEFIGYPDPSPKNKPLFFSSSSIEFKIS